MARESANPGLPATAATHGRFSRRAWLASYGWGAIAALWSGWLRAEVAAAQSSSRRARSVILIFNCGGPSHIDLWDPKPDAPDTIRGLYKPIATKIPGVQFSEMLPRMAERADKLAVVRSVHHTYNSHNSSMYWSIVGRPYPVDSTLIKPSRTDYPSFGTLTGWLAQRDGYSGELPPYVITPLPHCDSFVYVTPGQFGSCLGPKYDPFVLNSDPNAPGFKVPDLGLPEDISSDRVARRRDLLTSLARSGRPLEDDLAAALDQYRSKAMRLVTSAAVSQAFDLSRESTATRERYGRHSWGQSHLLARKLVEAGVPFVTTVNGPSIIWDTHKDNFNRLETKLVHPMEQAYAALLDDLAERGLLDSTLVVWMGDFGRTPKINEFAGRDHWAYCSTMVLAGGGIRGGQVVGESDKIGAYPTRRAVQPADIHATVFKALGYDSHAITYHTVDGRPVHLSDGEPMAELL